MEKHNIPLAGILKLFFASSSELESERNEVDALAIEINKLHDHIKIEVVKWETDLPSGSYENFQQEINKKLADCPIVAALFYSKIGNFSLEEFNLALALDKKVFLYFKKRGAKYCFPDDVQALRDKVKNEKKVFFKDYSSVADFKNKLKQDLLLYIKDKFPKPVEESRETGLLLTPRPPRVVQFVGRDKELKEVGALLKKAGQVVLVNGLGGIGKTELCKRFFYDHEKEYCVIAWIDYTGSIKESFARQLSIPGVPATPDETMDERFQKGVGDPGPRSPLRDICRRTDWCAGVSLFLTWIFFRRMRVKSSFTIFTK